jgi:hypothetical protein
VTTTCEKPILGQRVVPAMPGEHIPQPSQQKREGREDNRKRDPAIVYHHTHTTHIQVHAYTRIFSATRPHADTHSHTTFTPEDLALFRSLEQFPTPIIMACTDDKLNQSLMAGEVGNHAKKFTDDLNRHLNGLLCNGPQSAIHLHNVGDPEFQNGMWWVFVIGSRPAVNQAVAYFRVL